MYPPLTAIFDFIASLKAIKTPKAFSRQFYPTKSRLKGTGISNGTQDAKTTDFTPGFPGYTPNFSLIPAGNMKPKKWKHLLAFGEVKASRRANPNQPRYKNDPNNLLTQATDYARLHISSFPFLLFSVGLLVFGSDFCVCFFDREGIVISTTFSMWDDMAIFVKVVRRMCCDLSPVELGQDPTVQLLSSEEKRPEDRDTGMFLISPFGDDARTWCTVGEPLWSSFSLLGRGTTVWRVVPYANGQLDYDTEMVLKTAWRKRGRTPEADIYKLLGGHKGLARYIAGGDVRAPLGDYQCITVQWLRKPAAPVSPDTTPILHRLITRDVGRALWDYADDFELLQAIRAILDVLKELSDKGVVHRDISPGNVLLAGKAELAGTVGILHDVELADVPPNFAADKQIPISDTTPVPRRQHGYSGSRRTTLDTAKMHSRFTSSTLHGAEMTGTLLFMAHDILHALAKGETIQPTSEHDVESLAIVFIYTVLRRLRMVAKGEVVNIVETAFRRAFGHHSVARVLADRSAGHTTKWLTEHNLAPLVAKLSPAVRFVLASIHKAFIAREAAREAREADNLMPPDCRTDEGNLQELPSTGPLSHEFLSGIIDKAISLLETYQPLNSVSV